MSNQNGPSSSGSSIPKAIGSLAKKQSDVTRQGTQKLKFVPTLPQRRKKEEVKPEQKAEPVASSSQGDRGRGRGASRGDGGSIGRGRGRGAPPVLEMTASGPFAMGPALAGSSAKRSIPRSNLAPIVPSPGTAPLPGGGLTKTVIPSLKKEDVDSKGKGKQKQEEDDEIYSEPDEGVEIIDMEHVRDMDWMAPDSLRKERPVKKVKKEEKIESGDINIANALDLSESEEEEEYEDIFDNFTGQPDSDADPSMREERLFLFQFPKPFPTFVSGTTQDGDVQMQEPPISPSVKRVSFAADVKPGSTPETPRATSTAISTDHDVKVDGVIGQLEIYKSGAVKIRLENGILLDVNAASQPSFLQQAVHLDKTEKRLIVLGEVNKQFIVSPHVETLLAAMEKAEKVSFTLEGEENLIKIDA